jgi:cytochrome c556
MQRLLMSGCMAAALAIAGCGGGAPPAEPQPEPAPAAPAFQPVVSLNEVMVNVVNHNGHFIWDADIPGEEPTTDEDWINIEAAAVTLAAAGSITMHGGNGDGDTLWLDEPDWQRHSQALAGAGLAAIRAARNRDRMALTDAGNALVNSCINCHREYRLDVPEIWAREIVPEQ